MIVGLKFMLYHILKAAHVTRCHISYLIELIEFLQLDTGVFHYLREAFSRFKSLQ